MADFYGFFGGSGGGGGGGGSGTVTSVGLADGSTAPIYNISGSPVTTSGTLTFTLATQPANMFLAGPAVAGPAAQPTFRAIVAADIPSLSSLYWALSGNAVGAATGKVGTTDNFSWTTIANGGTIDTYNANLSVSSVLNITEPDATNYFQKRNQVNLSTAANTATANFNNLNNSVSYGGTGFDYAGNIISVSNAVGHNGTEHIGFIGSSSEVTNFTGGGHTDIVKGVNVGSAVTGPYQIDSFIGVGSYLTANQLTGDVKMYDSSPSITDSTLQGVTLYNGSVSIGGTSTLSADVTLLNVSQNIQDTVVAQNLVGGYVTLTAQDNSSIEGSTSLQLNTQLIDSVINNNQSYGINNVISSDNNASINGITAEQISIQTSGSSSNGNLIGVNAGISMAGASLASSVTGIIANPLLQGTSDGGNIQSASITGLVQGSANANQFTGLNVSPQVGGSATITSFSPFLINASINNTATVASGVTAADIQLSSSPTIPSAKGLSVNITGTTVADPLTRTGIQVQGGLNQYSYDFTVPAAAGFLSLNQYNNVLTVANGAPVDPITFATYISPTYVLHDDWSMSAFGIGPINVSSINSIAIDPTFTMDEHTGFMSGVTNASGSGTLTDSYGFRAAGVINQGGAIAATNVYGFSTFASTFGAVGTNVWAFFDNTIAENYLNRLAIGTASKKVSAGHVLDMVGQGLQTYSVTDATAIGIQLNETTHTTVDGSNNTEGFQANVTGIVDAGATNDKLVSGTVNTATRGNGTDDGILDQLSGDSALLFVNSGVAGVTNKTIGFDVTTILQQGTVTDLYDFRSTTVPAGGTATNQYGIYLGPGAGGVKKSWISDTLKVGGTSFSAPAATLDVNGNIKSNVGLILEDPGAGTNQWTIQSPTLAADYTLTLPVDDGTAGQVLTTNGSGVTSWTSSGTVTSVALADISSVPIYAITGSPVTTSGTLNFDLINQSANTVFSGPTAGGAAEPTFRALVAADIPAISLTSGVTGVLPLANGGTNNNITASNGAIAYSDASKILLSSVGTSGQVLTSGGAGAPTWTTPAAAPTWTSTAGVWTATVTNPTVGAGSVNLMSYSSNGKQLTVVYTLSFAGAPTSGTGQYLLAIPGGFTADTSFIAANANGILASSIGSNWTLNYNNLNSYYGTVHLYDANNFSFMWFPTNGALNANLQELGSTTFGFAAYYNFSFTATIPIT